MRKTMIYLTERQYGELEEIAYSRAHDRKTISEVVRDAVTEYLMKHGHYQPEYVQRGRPYRSPDAEAIERTSPYGSMDANSEATATAE
jgi:hypothetical protein